MNLVVDVHAVAIELGHCASSFCSGGQLSAIGAGLRNAEMGDGAHAGGTDRYARQQPCRNAQGSARIIFFFDQFQIALPLIGIGIMLRADRHPNRWMPADTKLPKSEWPP